MLRSSSFSQGRIYRSPTTFVPGIGQVPSGPRSWLSHRGRESRLTQADTSSSRPISIKQEDAEDESSMFMPVVDDALEDGEMLGTIKSEDTTATEEPLGLNSDFRYMFSSMIARYGRSTRSDTTGSRRQDTSEGRLSRSEALTSSSDRDRSRSPRSSANSRRPLYRDRSDNPMSSSDSREGSRSSQSAPRSVASVTQREAGSASSDESASPDRQSSSRSSQLLNELQSSPPPGDGDEIEDKRCRCPIGYICAVRSVNCLDCRPLVREYGNWTQRRDEEAFERHKELVSSGANSVTDANLVKIVNELNRFVTAASQTGRDAAVASMRAWIMEMEDVTITVGAQQSITNQQVLPALRNFLAPANDPIRRQKNLPAYIEEELTVLERKWGKGDFSGDVKRGLLVVEVSDVNGIVRYIRHRVDRSWPFYVSAKYFGAGDLVNGQIWESRVELQRDGVHAPIIAGISGTIKEGARSVVLGAFDEKHNVGYADIDMGEVIEYVGTALKDEEGLGPTNVKDPHMSNPGAWDQDSPVQPTACTRAMFKSMETGRPVRVIRSFKMCDIVTNKPTKGYRFDGMYRVVRATALKEARQIWSFRMIREPNQLPAHGPLRGFANGPTRRDARGQRLGHFTRT